MIVNEKTTKQNENHTRLTLQLTFSDHPSTAVWLASDRFIATEVHDGVHRLRWIGQSAETAQVSARLERSVNQTMDEKINLIELIDSELTSIRNGQRKRTDELTEAKRAREAVQHQVRFHYYQCYSTKTV